MINTVIARIDDGWFFEAEGHANYAERGKDIVCAAVSALACAVISELDELSACGKARFRSKSVSDGYIGFEVEPRGGGEFALGVLFDMLKNALRNLEELYPGCVTAEY